MRDEHWRENLVEYIAKSLEKGQDAGKLSTAVAAYLMENGHTSELQSIMRDVQELRGRRHEVVELSVSSAHDLEPAQISRIEDMAKKQYGGAKRVKIHNVHDENTLGGAKLVFANSVLDLSIRTKLNQLREAIG